MPGSSENACGRGGFTLVELLVVMAIIVLVLAMGVPLLTPSSSSQRSEQAMNAVMQAVRTARTLAEAEKRFTQVAFVTVQDAKTIPGAIARIEQVKVKRIPKAAGAAEDEDFAEFGELAALYDLPDQTYINLNFNAPDSMIQPVREGWRPTNLDNVDRYNLGGTSADAYPDILVDPSGAVRDDLQELYVYVINESAETAEVRRLLILRNPATAVER